MKAFQKVWLPAGAAKECLLELGAEDLSLWDTAMKFTLEPGDFTLFLEEGGTELARATFTVTQ